MPLVTSDGREIHVEFVSNVYLANNIKVIQCNIPDNTENWQIKNQIADSEEKFSLLFNEVEDAIFRYDHETYKIIKANEATSKIYGYKQEELIGMSALKFSAEVEKSKSASKTALQKGKTIVNFRHHKKKDGTDLFLKMQLHKIVLNNQPITYAVCHDITENVKYEPSFLFLKLRVATILTFCILSITEMHA